MNMSMVMSALMVIVFLITSLVYRGEGDAAGTAFWMGLAILNYLTYIYGSLGQMLKENK